MNGMAGASAGMSYNTGGPTIYDAMGGAGQAATARMTGAGGLSLEGGFFAYMKITPGVAIDMANGGVLATLSGYLSGWATDPVAVTSVTVTFQRKNPGASTGLFYDWASQTFVSAVPVSSIAALTAGQYAPSTAWRLIVPDSVMTDYTSYYVRAEAVNTSNAVVVAESTFIFNASMLLSPPGDGLGTAELSTNSAVGCQPITSTIAFTVSAAGIAPGGKIALHVPDGWTGFGGYATLAAGALPLPPPGTFYIQSPVAVSVEMNPPKTGENVLGDNWILLTAQAPLAVGQKIYFVYRGFPPGGALAPKPHVFKVLVQGSAKGNLVSIPTSPVMAPLAPGPPARLAFAPAEPIALGPLQSAPTMQIVLTDACGASTAAGSAFDVYLQAGRPGALDANATFYAAGGGPVNVVTVGAGSGVAAPPFYFRTSTTGASYEDLVATATIPGAPGRAFAARFVKLFSSSVTLSGVSVDTGALVAGAVTTTMTGNGFGFPAFINFALSHSDVRWEVIISTDKANFDPQVFHRSGYGPPGRSVAWNWIDEVAYPARAVPPGEYFVKILVEDGLVQDVSRRLYVSESAYIRGSVMAGGAGAYVNATGPSSTYGNFAVADENGVFRIYGLENGRSYNIAATTQVKTNQGQFLTLTVSSSNVTATTAGTDIGNIPFATPGFLRVSVSIPTPAPKEIWGSIKAHNADFTKTGFGTVHYTTGIATSDDGALGFGGIPSTWTVMGLPAGTYDLDIEVYQLGLSTMVSGVGVVGGLTTDQPVALQKRANVFGLAVLPATTTFGAWVSVQATKGGDKYPSLFGGSFIPGVSAGVDPTSSTFALYGLDPGSWTIRALAQGYVEASSRVLVTGSLDIGDQAGNFNLYLATAGVVRGTITVSGNTAAMTGLPDDSGDAFSVFVNAYNPATFSRAGIKVRLKKNASVTSSTFTLAGLENGSWVLSSQMRGFSDARQAVAVAGGEGLAFLRMYAYDARLFATVALPGGPHLPAEFRKVSLVLRSPDMGTVMLGDMTAGTTVQYSSDRAVWRSWPLAPGNYVLEAAYGATGMQRRADLGLTDNTTMQVTLDLTGPTYPVAGTVSLSGNVQFASATYSVSVSSMAGLLDVAPATSYCLMGSSGLPVNISAAHMELIPVDMKTGEYLSGPLRYSTSTTGDCKSVDLGWSVGFMSPHPFRGYVAAISSETGAFRFDKVAPGAYVLRNNADIDLDTRNGNELPQLKQVFSVTASTTLAPIKIEAGSAISGTVFLPPQTVMSRTVGVELLDNAGKRLKMLMVGFNNSDAASYLFDKLPDGSYAVAVHDLDVPKIFGAMSKTVKLSGASLAGEDFHLRRTGVIKGKIALQSRLPDGTTGPFLMVSNNNIHLLPSGFKVEAKANPWFQGGRRVAAGRFCGVDDCSAPALDANDQFVVEDLLPGLYDLKLWGYNNAGNLRNGAMSLIPTTLPGVKVEAGRVTDVGTAQVLSAVELRGTVTGSGGGPLSNIRMEARPSKREGGRESVDESYALTDKNGGFVLHGLNPVVRYYDVYAAMRPSNETEGSFVPPYEEVARPAVDLSCTTVLDFTLKDAPYRIIGRVAASGAPALSVQFNQGQVVPGARIFLQKEGVIPTKNPVADIEVFTAPDGSFEIPALTAGTYKLIATSLNYGSKTVFVKVEGSSEDVGVITLVQGGTLSGTIKKPDGSAPSQDEVQMVAAANSDMTDIVFGTLNKDENSRTVSEYVISGFKPDIPYTLVLVDRRDNLVAPMEARCLVFVSSSESRGLDLTYRPPKPKVFAKARRVGDEFRVEFNMTHPLRQKKASDDDYETILTTYSAGGTLADMELSSDRSRLSALYTPAVSESSFTLRLSGWSSVADPDSLDAEDPEFELRAVATFYAGIDGMHQNQMGNIWGGNMLIEGDQGRITIPSGAFGVGASSSVEVALNISSEPLSRFGVKGMGKERRMRFAPAAYPDELLRAMSAVPPQINPFSAFYNVMLPLGLTTALSRPVQMTVTYSSGTDPTSLNLYWYNPVANIYVLQQDVTGAAPVIDAVNRTITINVSHFSTFVLFQTGVTVVTGDAFYGTGIEAFNFPNPFDLEVKTVTTIHPNTNHLVRGTMMRFALADGVSGDASIRIHGVTGELIRKIELGHLAGGRHYYQGWDGRNDSGRDVASGVYIGVLKVGKKVQTFRMAVIK
ncbi:MAG: hypothetical protein HY748_16510 [Elusimicrobia bacterium]|nr:hypothetical protein [Elusimicrobiota bacterium]